MLAGGLEETSATHRAIAQRVANVLGTSTSTDFAASCRHITARASSMPRISSATWLRSRTRSCGTADAKLLQAAYQRLRTAMRNVASPSRGSRNRARAAAHARSGHERRRHVGPTALHGVIAQPRERRSDAHARKAAPTSAQSAQMAAPIPRPARYGSRRMNKGPHGLTVAHDATQRAQGFVEYPNVDVSTNSWIS